MSEEVNLFASSKEECLRLDPPYPGPAHPRVSSPWLEEELAAGRKCGGYLARLLARHMCQVSGATWLFIHMDTRHHTLTILSIFCHHSLSGFPRVGIVSLLHGIP